MINLFSNNFLGEVHNNREITGNKKNPSQKRYLILQMFHPCHGECI